MTKLRSLVIVKRDREDHQVVLWKLQRLRLRIHDMQPERHEQSKDAARLRRSRRIVVAGDHHDHDVRQRGTKPRKLHVRVNDGAVRRAHLVEHVPRNEHEIRRKLDGLVDRSRKRLRDVGLSLIDAARSQPLILAEAEVQIGEVNEAQGVSGEGELRRLRRR